jgi:signal transduction histidine kinase
MDETAISDLQKRLAAASEALRRSEERATAGQLALEVMHEVRNPLEALGHLIYLGLQEANDAEKVQKYLRLAQEQMGTLTQIAGQTLEFARPSHVRRSVELILLAESALRIHQRRIEAKKIHLVRNLAQDAVAEVYSGEMLQVLSNLIANALDALPDGGVLRLALRKRKDKVHLLVADNGHGISPELREAVFQPFFTTKGEHGSGLGLALSKRIVDRHDGTMRMRSSIVPGKSGTAFRIVIPRQEQAGR